MYFHLCSFLVGNNDNRIVRFGCKMFFCSFYSWSITQIKTCTTRTSEGKCVLSILLSLTNIGTHDELIRGISPADILKQTTNVQIGDSKFIPALARFLQRDSAAPLREEFQYPSWTVPPATLLLCMSSRNIKKFSIVSFCKDGGYA